MRSAKTPMIVATCLVAACLAAPARAAWPVIDIGAILQLVNQGRQLSEQIDTARDQLDQAREEFEAQTGSRGMERLLGNTARQYLPADWAQLSAVIEGTGGTYGALAAELERAIAHNAVLSEATLATLGPEQRRDVELSRRAVATLQALTRQALVTTSQRFDHLQQLIDAIAAADDQKAILELQARIGAEATMLENEQTKLQTVYQAARAEAEAQQQRLRERAIADIGSFRRLPPMRL